MNTDTPQTSASPDPQVTVLEDEHAPVGTIVTADPATLPPILASITLPEIPEPN